MNNIENNSNDSLSELEDSYGNQTNDENFLEKLFWLFDLLKMSLVLLVLIQTFFYRTMHIEGDSMQTTFQPKDSVGVTNFFYSKPKNGDIVIINTTDLLQRTIIKRVIAVENQVIDIDHDGNVYVDEVKKNEPYIKKGWKTDKRNLFTYPIKIPKGCFFAMGDNRGGSDDSRVYGFFKYDQVVGKVFVRFWPLNKFKFF